MKAGAASQTADPPQRLEQAARLEGGALLPGLVLGLQELWEG